MKFTFATWNISNVLSACPRCLLSGETARQASLLVAILLRVAITPAPPRALTCLAVLAVTRPTDIPARSPALAARRKRHGQLRDNARGQRGIASPGMRNPKEHE
jgi:hypothetical protein